MDQFLLAHLSDPHLTPPAMAWTWADTLSKRGVSRISWWRKRRHIHRSDVLTALISDVSAHALDHVAITGDLVNFARPEEFAAAAAWVGALGPSRQVTVSPGNHDVLVAKGAPERLASWRMWLGDDGAGFPYLRRRGRVAIINLCSGVPTPPFSAQGEIGAPQLGRLSDMLQACRAEKLVRVVLLHHPPGDGVVSERKCLIDRQALREVFHLHGAELVLHGHAHETTVSAIPGPNGTIPVLGAPSASAVAEAGHPSARWHAIEIEGDGETAQFRVVARGLDRHSNRIVHLGRYKLAP